MEEVLRLFSESASTVDTVDGAPWSAEALGRDDMDGNWRKEPSEVICSILYVSGERPEKEIRRSCHTIPGDEPASISVPGLDAKGTSFSIGEGEPALCVVKRGDWFFSTMRPKSVSPGEPTGEKFGDSCSLLSRSEPDSDGTRGRNLENDDGKERWMDEKDEVTAMSGVVAAMPAGVHAGEESSISEDDGCEPPCMPGEPTDGLAAVKATRPL